MEDVVGVVVECEYRPVVIRHVQPCIALIAIMRHSSALIIHSRDLDIGGEVYDSPTAKIGAKHCNESKTFESGKILVCVCM